MVRTTAASPVDVVALVPRLAEFARTTVRLHPRPGAPGPGDSSMGGPPLWPAAEPWPACAADHSMSYDLPAGDGPVPLVPVLQLFARDVPDLPFPPGTDVLQVLWCPFDHLPFSAVEPRLFWRAAPDAGGRLVVIPPPDAGSPAEHVPRPCVLHPEPVVEFPAWDLPGELLDWTWEADTVAGRLRAPSGIMLGDVGGIHVFVCARCPGPPFDYRFDNS